MLVEKVVAALRPGQKMHGSASTIRRHILTKGNEGRRVRVFWVAFSVEAELILQSVILSKTPNQYRATSQG